MRIVVTGGAGFIGSAFINYVKNNFETEILCVDKLTYAGKKKNIRHNVSFLEKDICDVTSEELGDYDYLVHFAAETHVDNSIEDGRPFIRTNVEGTFNLLECARKNKNLKKFIHISTDEVYGDMYDYYLKARVINKSADEDHELKGSSYYSASKASSDLLVMSANRTFGLPYIITRTCNNYGSHQDKEKFIPKIMDSIKNNKIIPVYGDGKQKREWINVNDNVEMIYRLMISDLTNEIFNIGSNETYTNIEIINIIGELLGKKPKYEFVKDRLGHDRVYLLNSSKLKKHFPDFKPKSFKNFLNEEINKIIPFVVD